MGIDSSKFRKIRALQTFLVPSVDLKNKYTTRELHVKFYLGQSENCSLGDSTSDNSEKLL